MIRLGLLVFRHILLLADIADELENFDSDWADFW